MLEGVAVVWMPVQDIDRAKNFYQGTLGLNLTKEDGGANRAAMFPSATGPRWTRTA